MKPKNMPLAQATRRSRVLTRLTARLTDDDHARIKSEITILETRIAMSPDPASIRSKKSANNSQARLAHHRGRISR